MQNLVVTGHGGEGAVVLAILEPLGQSPGDSPLARGADSLARAGEEFGAEEEHGIIAHDSIGQLPKDSTIHHDAL